jgi:hypothetical protein
MTKPEILEDFPSLTNDDLLAVAAWAAIDGNHGDPSFDELANYRSAPDKPSV